MSSELPVRFLTREPGIISSFRRLYEIRQVNASHRWGRKERRANFQEWMGEGERERGRRERERQRMTRKRERDREKGEGQRNQREA